MLSNLASRLKVGKGRLGERASERATGNGGYDDATASPVRLSPRLSPGELGGHLLVLQGLGEKPSLKIAKNLRLEFYSIRQGKPAAWLFRDEGEAGAL